MADDIRLSLKGIDRADLLELKELLEENGAGNLRMDEAPNEVLKKGHLGAPELLDVAIQLAPIVVPAVTTAVALWITRKKERKSIDYVAFEIDGDKLSYQRFSGDAFAQASDPAAVKSILQAKLKKR